MELLTGPKILNIAKYRNHTCWQLFSNYWRIIAPNIVKKMQQLPNLVHNFSSILGVNTLDFLARTCTFTLGVLVLNGQKESVLKIAEACDQDIRSFLLSNAPSIIAYILGKEGIDMRDNLIDKFAFIEDGFNRIELSDLIQTEPIATTIEAIQYFDESCPSQNENVRISRFPR